VSRDRRTTLLCALLIAALSGACKLEDVEYGAPCEGDAACAPGHLCHQGICVPDTFQLGDASSPDRAGPDSTSLDAGLPDGARPDGARPDGAGSDGAGVDASLPDSSSVDAAPPFPDAACSYDSATGYDVSIYQVNGADSVGWSVAASVQTVVVGAPEHNGYVGQVSIYDRIDAGWSHAAVADDNLDSFGASVAVQGDQVMAGAYYTNVDAGEHAGEVIRYARNAQTPTAWDKHETFRSQNPQPDGYFGYSLALSRDGRTLAVGAPGERISGSSHGRVYVFDHNGVEWPPTAQELDYPGPTEYPPSARFGEVVALSDDGLKLAVTASGEDRTPGTASVGVVRIYRRTTRLDPWIKDTYEASLDASDGNWGELGEALAFAGNYLLVGVPGLGQEGAVFVYEPVSTSHWDRPAVLNRPEPLPCAVDFGHAIAVGGSLVLVGATTDVRGEAIPDRGEAYLYEFSGPPILQLITALPRPEAGADDRFGQSVALSEDDSVAVVGAPQAGGTGAAYIYTAEEPIDP